MKGEESKRFLKTPLSEANDGTEENEGYVRDWNKTDRGRGQRNDSEEEFQ